MNVWIDVENAAGVRYGDGPITTVSGWESTRRLDAAGTFSFSMPAADERSNLLAHKRIVRCWSASTDGVKELGAGIVEQIEVQPSSEDGPAMLRVSGDDLLRELANRSVGALDLFEAVEYSTTDDDPCILRLQGWTFGDDLTVPASVDLRPITGTTLEEQETFLYVQHVRAFSKITLTLTATNTALSDTFQVQYYNAQDIENPTWESLPGVINNTAGDGPPESDSIYPFGVLGEATIEFDPPMGWSPLPNGLYVVRLFDQVVDLTSFTVSAASVTIVEPVADGLQRIMALAPAGWSLDPAGEYATAKPVYMQLSGESVLAALVQLAEQTGEHFTLAPSARRLWWLGMEQAASGLRAVQVSQPDDDTMAITALSRNSDSYDLYTRLYAHGGGVGSGRLTMALTTRSEAGYTLGPDGLYLEADTATETYGRIDCYEQYSDIAPVDVSETQMRNAANALYDRVYHALRRHSQLQYAYILEVAPGWYDVWPGQTIVVQYHEWVDGYHAVDISETLWVLETTQRIGSEGVLTVGLTVATVDYAPPNDYNTVARLMGSVRIERNTDLPASRFSNSRAGIPVVLNVAAGQVTAVRRVQGVEDRWHDAANFLRIRTTSGIITAIEFGSSTGGTGGTVFPPKPIPWPP